ncbi:hypothetical protein L7F22_001505 [Adiantum nelumboides]|nr:hypothetical protein [Adiantum nelumboides]
MTYSIGRGVLLRRIEIDAAIPHCWIDAVTEPPVESQSFLIEWWAFFRTTHSPPSWARWGDLFFVVLPDFRLVHGDFAPPMPLGIVYVLSVPKARMNELEHLDERRLTAIHVMYVEKRRRKAWYDKNLRVQEFKEGDLVLLYSLKKDKQKLTPRGIGPYVINTITNGGAVRLETLEGEQMANFINGSRLRRYHEPLTDEILERLHAAKNKKERNEQIKIEAQEEAKCRARKNRERKFHISCVSKGSGDGDGEPPLLVKLNVQGESLTFFLNSKAEALGLDHHARGLCHKQDVVHSQPSITMQDVLQADHFQPRSPMQLLAALEVHVTSSGKELLASLKDSLCWASEKEKSLKVQIDKQKEVSKSIKAQIDTQEEVSKSLKAQIDKQEEVSKLLREMRARDQVSLLQLKGLNDTRGLFEKLQEDLAAKAQDTTRLKGSSLWEAILKNNQALCDCIHGCIKIPAGDHKRQAAHCSAIYDVFLQHVHAGKELAELQAANGDILFQRGPMSPQQVQILLCMGQAASVDIPEDPSTRPS